MHAKFGLFVNIAVPNPISKVDIETALKYGSASMLKKDCKILTEKSHGNEKVDLVPSLQKTIQNPSNLIEGEALDGWIRGGLPARDLTRSSN